MEVHSGKNSNQLLEPKDGLINIKDFIIQKQIDTDTIGQIYKVIHKKTKEIFLAKHISDDMSSKSNEISTIINKASKFCFPSVLQFIGYSPIDFEKKDKPIIFVEDALIFTLNDFFQYYKISKIEDLFDDTFKLIIIYGIASAMAYIHSIDIIHEELHPSNIFFSNFLLPKVATFFFSNNFSIKNNSIYSSPETLKKSEVSKLSNVYSFGVIAFEIMTQKDASELSNLENVAPSYKNLIERCCSEDPKNRPSFVDILAQLKNDHGFITEKVNKKDFIDYINYIDKCKNDEKIDNFIDLKSKIYSKFNETVSNFDKFIIEPKERSKFINLDRFYITKNIGSGSFSNVFQVKEIVTNNIYAAKILKDKISDDYMNDEKTLLFYREIKLLSILDHPAIIKFIGFSPIDFKQSMHPTIITEYLKNGALRDILNLEKSGLSPKHWDDTKKLIIIYGIASGMLYLHSNNIIHRDLKPENILLDEHLQPKISDFGLSKATKSSGRSLFAHSLIGYKGTPLYMPPETLRDYVYSTSGDVFAFSLIVYEMLTLNEPYPSFNIIDLYTKVVIEGQRPILANDISQPFKNLIKCCWSSNSNERPTFQQIVDDLKTNKEYISETINENEFLDYVDFVDNIKTSFDLDQSICFAQLAKENRMKKAIIKANIHKNSSFNEEEEEEESEDSNKNENIEILKFKIKEANVNIDNNNSMNTEQSINKSQVKGNVPKIDKKNKLKSNNSYHRKVTFSNLLKIIEDESNDENITNPDNAIKEMSESDESNDENITNSNNVIKEMSESDETNDENIANSDNVIKEMNELDKPKSLFVTGKNLIEGSSKCKDNIENGIKNLEKAISLSCTEAIIYYCNLLIEGKIIPRNIEKAKSYIEKYFDKNDSNSMLLLGKIYFHEKKFSEAINQFKKSAKQNNLEAMYEYGKMLFFGQGCEKNDTKAMKYFHLSKLQGYENSIKFIIIYQEVYQIFSFTMLDIQTQLFFISEIINHSLANIHIPNNKKLAKFENIISKISSSKSINSSTYISRITPKETYYKGKWEKIVFTPEKTKKLFLNNMYFNEMLTYFKNVIFQIEIEPRTSSEIRDTIFEIEKKFNTKIELSMNGSFLTSIEPNLFKCCSYLYQISIPQSVTSIGESAFCECSNLTQILIPSSVKSIEKRAFSGCFSLKHISIPPSVIKIESFLFKNCSSLEQISMPSSVTSIGEGAFFGCASLEQISIPSSVKLIEQGAFCDCSSLKIITIPSSITSVEPYLFKNCSFLSNISISSSITSIKEGAFFGCTSLEQISIPSSVKLIEKGAFLGCTSLTQISIPNSITSIEMTTFKKCSSLTQISIPNSVLSIGEAAFYECSSLNQVHLPPICTIGVLTFYKCSALTQIIIPSSVKSIENDAFCNCSLLEKISIPSSVKSIGNCSFSNCKSLTQIIIPSSVKSIGYEAFSRCTSLTQIKIPSSVKSIGIGAFLGCSSLIQISIKSSTKSIKKSLFKDCKSLSKIKLPSIRKICGYSFYGCLALTDIAIPSSVFIIKKGAFKSCSSLTKISIPSSVKSIQNEAFYGCSSLKQINFPSSISYIGESAFSFCSSLTKIIIPNSITSIERITFLRCISLSEISIPSSVIKIEDGAFLGCSSLTNISIPSSVIKIGINVFFECSSLTQIALPSSFDIKSNLIGLNTNVIVKKI